jgi:hypothetical protein
MQKKFIIVPKILEKLSRRASISRSGSLGGARRLEGPAPLAQGRGGISCSAARKVAAPEWRFPRAFVLSSYA